MFWKIGTLEVEVNGIPQKLLNQLVKVPYESNVTPYCKSQNVELLTFINTTLDLDENWMNGLSPYLLIASNITIDHFNARNRGSYSCATNISTNHFKGR